MGPVRIGLSKPSGQVSSEATKSQSQNSADHQEGRTGSTVPPCSTSTAPSDLATDTPTLSCSSVSLETFSPTPSVLTGGSPFQAFFFFCLSLLSVVGFSNFSQPMIASVEACLTKKKKTRIKKIKTMFNSRCLVKRPSRQRCSLPCHWLPCASSGEIFMLAAGSIVFSCWYHRLFQLASSSFL